MFFNKDAHAGPIDETVTHYRFDRIGRESERERKLADFTAGWRRWNSPIPA